MRKTVCALHDVYLASAAAVDERQQFVEVSVIRVRDRTSAPTLVRALSSAAHPETYAMRMFFPLAWR